MRVYKKSTERFAKQDQFRVRLRVCFGQRQDGRKRTEYFIEEVIEHHQVSEPPDLF